MRFARLLAFGIILLLVACQPTSLPTIQIIDNEHVIMLQTSELVPSALLSQAGIRLDPNNRILLNGLTIAPDKPITNSLIANSPVTLQVRRAKSFTLITPKREQKLDSSAFTIGEALLDASVSLHASDQVTPPLHAPISQSSISISPLTIYQLPIRELTIIANGRNIGIRSSAQTVGEALAEAGIPLIGLDYSIPPEAEPLPANGQIRIVHVTESMQLAQKPIPFESEIQASADVPLDQTQILQPGEVGLTMQRIRIRFEDGEEVSRLTEDETIVRPPTNRIMAFGTKVEVRSAVVDGVNIEYWRAVQMYATSYSPCRSGVDRCYSGTSSGKSLRKGLVGLRYSWYLSMQGQQLYVPGYGFATVEDVCGGCVGKPWIDLGFSDNDFEPWHSWVTVYFLTPVPPHVIYVLE